MTRSTLGMLAIAGLLTACQESSLIDPSETFSAAIVEGDTTVLRGESMSLSSMAEYRFGPGIPIAVTWGQSDTAVLGLAAIANGQVQVTAKAAGTSLVVARINELFLDTITVTVVDTGAVRWRRTVVSGGATHGWDLAVSDSGFVATTDGAGQMVVFRANGDTVWRTPGACAHLTGPAVTANGYWSSGAGCTARFSIDGVQTWSQPVGGSDDRMAVAANGDVVVLALIPADSVIALTRYNLTGALVWRDTLMTGATTSVGGGVAIAGNGDIYVAWSMSISRFTSAGVQRWELPLTGMATETAPAVVGARVHVVHSDGVSVRDSAGAVVYDRLFTDVFPTATGPQMATPPVVDGSGNVYVQLSAGLFSLTNAGVVRWAADSLVRGGRYNSGPSILQGGSQLVALCGLQACGISASAGTVAWRGPAIVPAAGSFGGLAMGTDGTLFVMFDNEVVALWHRRQLGTQGWPTLGGNRGRSGTAP